MLVKRLMNILFICAIVSSLLLHTISQASAQAIDNPSFENGVVTLAQLGEDEFTLTGPFDSNRVTFGLPANWRLSNGAELEIALSIAFSELETTGNTSRASSVLRNGGSVAVVLNNVVLGVLHLTEVGEITIKYPIPQDALVSRRDDGLMELEFQLESGIDCNLDQNTFVIVHSYSTITLPHTNISPNTDLINFPRPLFSNSFTADSAIVVIPDKPTQAELQSALTIGAGLANITNSDLMMTMVPNGNLTAEQLNTSHIILVGQPKSFESLISQLDVQSLIENDEYHIDGLEADDGVIQMAKSVWSLSRVVLIVSGNTDAGVLKASQALTTGIIRAGSLPNVAVVKSVHPVQILTPSFENYTLADLGYKTEVMDARGSTDFSYEFNIPPGKVLGSDAFFELAYGHSGLLEYDRSGIVITLNGQPIGSVKLAPETSTQPINRAKISIPPSLAQTGKNQIEVFVNVVPFDICTSRDINSDWITIWPDSLLHLPLSDTINVSPNAVSDLALYPSPFINEPTLSTTAFVLEPNDLISWQAAFDMARFLGDSANGTVTFLKTFYSSQLAENDYPLYNFIVVGRPSNSSFIKLFNEDLPGPFDTNSNIALEQNMPATFLISPDVPIGYIELIQSPWDYNKIIITVVGNSDQGILWAARPMGDSPLRSLLAGNFSVINDQRVISTDTRLTPLASLNLPSDTTGSLTPTPLVPVNAPDNTPLPVSNNTWILPLIAALIILTIITLIAIVYPGWVNNRTNPNNNKPSDKT